ncbi:GPW/gp25 family protein [uncultured Oscillibacter sp.]|uniref:GPW/gp25 family protein n=1 Tax=uncultured Oscillibacter sp. TaxID=876091 RepID=UPI0025E35907|nr:GPW/gp25 family protein [uncultured Oscillibacter sp.]
MNGKEFLGRGLKFPLQVDPRTGKLAMVDQEEDIREAIGIILRTGQGERVMRPEFGARTMDYAFAPASSSMTHSIAHDLRILLLEQEPRIRDVEVRCERLDRQDGAVVIEVDYTVRSTNNRYNHVYPFYVTEGSEGGAAE